MPDWLALRLLLRRHKPDVLLVEMNNDGLAQKYLTQLLQDPAQYLAGVRLIGIHHGASEDFHSDPAIEFHSILSDDCGEQQLLDAVLAPNSTGVDLTQGSVAMPILNIESALEPALDQ